MSNKIQKIINDLTESGGLSKEQSTALLDISSQKIIPLYQEIRAVLFGGVAFFLVGLGVLIKKYFDQLGHVSIIGFLSIGSALSIGYCFTKGKKYSPNQVIQPSITFDYVLYIGCVLFSLLITYVETHFQLLDSLWKNYLLGSFILFLYFSFRFDNRFVLSLSLGTLAAWFGFSLNEWDKFFLRNYHLYGIAYGILTGILGLTFRKIQLKPHFLNTFLHFSIHFIFISLLPKSIETPYSLYTLGVALMVVSVARYAFYSRSFIFILYAVIYGYVDLSVLVIDALGIREFPFLLLYFIASSVSVLFLMLSLSRKFKDNS